MQKDIVILRSKVESWLVEKSVPLVGNRTTHFQLDFNSCRIYYKRILSTVQCHSLYLRENKSINGAYKNTSVMSNN